MSNNLIPEGGQPAMPGLRYFKPYEVFEGQRNKKGEVVHPARGMWYTEPTPDNRSGTWSSCLCVLWRPLRGWQRHPDGPSRRRFDRKASPTWGGQMTLFDL